MEDRIKKLEKQVEFLMDKRILQTDLTPDVVKMRHVGEGVRFIRSGLEADLPTVGETCLQGQPFYWATDTNKLYGWNGTAWVSATFA